MLALNKITELAHYYAANYLKAGQTAIDATAGKGFDTSFLAARVGPTGRVYAFDIQKTALQLTAQRLQKLGLEQRVVLINDSHEKMALYVQEPVSVVMFNLGYLPGGRHQITTSPNSTIDALKAALSLIKTAGGLISIVIYPGHEAGLDEKNHLLTFCADLSAKEFTVMHSCILNRSASPPELMMIQRILFSGQSAS